MKSGKLLKDACNELRSGSNNSAPAASPSSAPAAQRREKVGLVRVFAYANRLHALSSQRLALYRLLEQCDSLKQIKVKVIRFSDVKKEKSFTGVGETVAVKDIDGVVRIIGTSSDDTTFNLK